MKRTQLARTAPLVTRLHLKRGTGLTRTPRTPSKPAQPASPRPKRPSRTVDIPQDARDLVTARSQGRCEIQAPGPCTGQATDIHHRMRRREGGHTVDNLLHTCRHCHGKAHAHPQLARAFGWIVPTWADPTNHPLSHRGTTWVLLNPDGTFTPTEQP